MRGHFRLKVIALLVGLLTLVASLLYGWEMELAQEALRSETMAQTEKRAGQLADAVGEQAATLVRSIDFALRQLRDEHRAGEARFNTTVDSVLKTFPGGTLVHVAVIGADGYVAYSSLGLTQRTFVGDREHFKVHQDGQDRLHISRPIFGRVSKVWSVLFTRPLLRDGRFAGVMVISVSPEYVSQRLSGFEMSPRDVIALLHLDGSFIARNRDMAKALGKAVPAERPLLRPGAPARGTFVEEGSTDKVRRVFAWHRLEDAGLLAVVGLDEAAVLQPLEAQARAGRIRAGIVIALLLGFGLGVSALLLRSATQQQQLSASEAKYRRLYEGMTDAYASVDMAGRLRQWNAAFRDMLGYSDDELGRLGYTDLTPAKWHEIEYRIVNEQVLVRGYSDVYTKEYVRKNGTAFPVELRTYLVSDERGEPEGMWAIVRDITARRSEEERMRQLNEALEQRVVERTTELREVAELNQRMIEAATLGIAAFRHSGECVFANEAGAHALGMAREQLLKADFHTLASWGESGLRDVALRVLEVGQPDEGEFHVVAANREIWLDCYFAPFTRGGARHFLLISNDVTARKQAEQQLVRAKELAEKASRAKSEFLARMSHELRTPMNAILGFAQLLEIDTGDAQARRQSAREILDAGAHLLELINELLDLSRIESGRLTLTLEPVDVGATIADALRIGTAGERAADIDVSSHVPAGSRYVLADAVRLRQVLINFISNAIKYNRAGGRVAIDCRPATSSMLRIVVTDTGPGIPADKQAALFQPFERLGIERGGIDGVGIGLALSRSLAELMGGSVGVDSTPGGGSSFWIELPAAVAAAHIPSLPAAVEAAHGDGKTIEVLYIEDNPANLRLVQKIFQGRPELRLLVATDGELGVELAQRHHPALVLMDIHLPGIDGYEALRRLRADPGTADIPVVAVSADAMTTDVEHGLAEGFNRYLTKPINVPELLAIIDGVRQSADPARRRISQ